MKGRAGRITSLADRSTKGGVSWRANVSNSAAISATSSWPHRPGKAGSVVSCPRCKADLVVPAPESPAPGDPESELAVGKASGAVRLDTLAAEATTTGDLDEVAAAIPADLIDLRPEDLRVEAEFFHSLTRPPEPAREPEPAPWVAQLAQTPDSSPGPGIPVTADCFTAGDRRAGLGGVAARALSARSRPADRVASPDVRHSPPMSPDVPPIEIEAPSLLRRLENSSHFAKWSCPRRRCSPGHCSG